MKGDKSIFYCNFKRTQKINISLENTDIISTKKLWRMHCSKALTPRGYAKCLALDINSLKCYGGNMQLILSLNVVGLYKHLMFHKLKDL